MRQLCGAAALILAFWGCAKETQRVGVTSSETTRETPGAAMPAAVDREFVHEAAIGGLLEVRLGEVAQRQGSNDRIKDFGRRMVEDHSKANNELVDIASRKNIKVPTELEGKEKATFDRLSKLHGAEFDRAYASAMVKDHQEDIAKFRRQVREGKDPDLRSFAERTLPTLETHLHHAEEANAAVGKAR